MIERFAAAFERFTVGVLVLLLMATILFGTVIVGWSLLQDLLHTQELVAEPKALFDVFGLFVAVLVGVELLKILRHVMVSHEVDTVLVVETALIALCNKVITLNLSSSSWSTLLSIAALILGLAAAIHALSRLRAH
jgi:uncharacterized membrane protein (DUF373 family)